MEGRSRTLNPVIFFSIIEWLIIALALTGLVISLYFTFAYYGRIKKSRWIPEIVCAREGSSCATVVQTPYARVFGVPNSLLGIFYYFALILMFLIPDGWWVIASDHAMRASRAAQYILLAANVATVALGFYLIYALRRILHIDCPLCYTAHGINLAIFVLLIAVTW